MWSSAARYGPSPLPGSIQPGISGGELCGSRWSALRSTSSSRRQICAPSCPGVCSTVKSPSSVSPSCSAVSTFTPDGLIRLPARRRSRAAYSPSGTPSRASMASAPSLNASARRPGSSMTAAASACAATGAAVSVRTKGSPPTWSGCGWVMTRRERVSQLHASPYSSRTRFRPSSSPCWLKSKLLPASMSAV
uniref:Orf144a protein n=1 Tax=Deinococcus radiodurans TaxID=1299 RepID=O32503_DEIRD|nr:orf144a [Deinococcus radiodurans]